jgi:hypothetical protein
VREHHRTLFTQDLVPPLQCLWLDGRSRRKIAEGDETVPTHSSDSCLWHADLQHPLLTLEIAQYLRQSRSLFLATHIC